MIVKFKKHFHEFDSEQFDKDHIDYDLFEFLSEEKYILTTSDFSEYIGNRHYTDLILSIFDQQLDNRCVLAVLSFDFTIDKLDQELVQNYITEIILGKTIIYTKNIGINCLSDYLDLMNHRLKGLLFNFAIYCFKDGVDWKSIASTSISQRQGKTRTKWHDFLYGTIDEFDSRYISNICEAFIEFELDAPGISITIGRKKKYGGWSDKLKFLILDK